MEDNSWRSTNVPTATVTTPMSMLASLLDSYSVDDRYDDGVSVTKTTANLKTESFCRAPFDAVKMSERTAAKAAARFGEWPPYLMLLTADIMSSVRVKLFKLNTTWNGSWLVTLYSLRIRSFTEGTLKQVVRGGMQCAAKHYYIESVILRNILGHHVVRTERNHADA